MKLEGTLTREEFFRECSERLKEDAERTDGYFNKKYTKEIMQSILTDGEPAPDIEDRFDLLEDQMDATRFHLAVDYQRAFNCTSIVAITKWMLDEDGEPEIVEDMVFLFD